MSGDVIGVIVGLQHVLDMEVVEAAEPQVGVDVPLRVDHDRDPCGDVADHIRRAAEVLMDDLTEKHDRLKFA
jgi:hypothetical protein